MSEARQLPGFVAYLTHTAAAFVKRNMPIGFHGKFPPGQGGFSDQEALDLAECFSHQSCPDFPERSMTGQWIGSLPTQATERSGCLPSQAENAPETGHFPELCCGPGREAQTRRMAAQASQ